MFLTREDGIVENISAIFYLVGFLVSFSSIFKNERVLLASVWAALCLLFLGEETSWFQRLLHYSVPFVEERNAQHEFNLHNLVIFTGRPLRDALGELDFNVLLNVSLEAQNLFQIGFFVYFLIIPFSLHISKINTLMSSIGYKKPDTSFILVIFFIIALSFFLAAYCSLDIKSALAETREMLYAYFILVYIKTYI